MKRNDPNHPSSTAPSENRDTAASPLSEAGYKTIIRTAIDGFWIVDLQGRLREVNDAYCKMSGYDQDELLGKHITDLEIAESPEEVAQRMEKILATGSERFTARHEKKDGTPLDLDVSVQLMERGDGFVVFLRDVTRHKKTEMELVESETRYRALFEHDGNGIFLFNTDTFIITDVNPAMTEIYGYEREELIGRNSLELSAEVQESLKATEESKKEGEVEVPVRYHKKKDGTVFPVRLYLYRWKLDNQPTAFVRVQDITEQERVTQSARKAEARLTSALNELSEGYQIIRFDWRYLYLNDSAVRQGRKSREEFIGKIFMEVLPGVEETEMFKTLQRVMLQRTPERLENEFQYADGEQRWFDLNIQPVEEGIFILSTDITKRKRIERQLADEQERLRTILDTVADPIFVKSDDHHMVLANRAFDEIFGLEPGVSIGKTLAEHVPEEEREQFLSVDRAVLDTGEEHVVEETLTVRDRATKTIVTKKSRFVDGAGNRYLVGTIHDITDMRKAEEQLQQAQRLEAIGTLAGGIAHDFNNILTSLMGSIQLARMDLQPESAAHHTLSESQAACQRASELTKQLLTFSKGGQPVLRYAKLEEELKEWVRFALRGSNTDFRFEIDPDLSPVEADSGQISQVVHNLVLNADQAMPQGGVISIRADNLRLAESGPVALPKGDYVRIQVVDQGVGIPPTIAKKIFDPYFSTKAKGMGLGLASSYAIMKKHGGLLRLVRTGEAGSAFEAILPATERMRENRDPDACEVALGGGRILLMDDDRPLLQISSKMIQRLGYEVDISLAGDEAVERYRSALEADQAYKAVILDMTVPGKMGGKATLKKLLEIDPNARAIVSSGYADNETLSRYGDFGFKAMLAKPFTLEELSRALRKTLAEG